MKTRYDFMEESAATDIDGESYPDPLSLNYLSFIANDYIETYELSEHDLSHMWRIFNNKYGAPELDDIVLTLNGISHRNFLSLGQKIYLPSREDIERSFVSS